MVAQLHGAHRNFLYLPAQFADFQVLADPESIIHQEENTADHVAHQRLGAKTDGEADNAGTGQQWANINASRRQHHQHRKQR